MCHSDPLPPQKDTPAQEKVKRRGANKAGDTKPPPYQQRQSRLGICRWGSKPFLLLENVLEGGKTKGKCRSKNQETIWESELGNGHSVFIRTEQLRQLNENLSPVQCEFWNTALRIVGNRDRATLKNIYYWGMCLRANQAKPAKGLDLTCGSHVPEVEDCWKLTVHTIPWRLVLRPRCFTCSFPWRWPQLRQGQDSKQAQN